MNGVNGDVPFDNDGGEKVVGTLLVDDSGSGPILDKSQSQMDKAKRINIPFTFSGEPKGRLRKKRDARLKAIVYSIGTGIALIMGIIFAVKVAIMYNHKNTVGTSNLPSDYQTRYKASIYVSGISIAICALLFVLAFWHCCICRGRVMFLPGPGNPTTVAGARADEVEMINQAVHEQEHGQP